MGRWPDYRAGVRRHHGVAFIRYGRDLDGLLVIEKKAEKRHSLELPTVDINGSTAKVLDTPLGSIVSFERNGISYTVLGSVHADVAETAARGL